MTWEIFLGIVALFSFMVAVMTPLLKLNSNIIKLNEAINTLKDFVNRVDSDNEKSHKRIWDALEGITEKLEVEDKRLNRIEHTMEVTEKLHPELVGLRGEDR